MARLPNTYDRRPAPSFGRTRTPAPVVEVDKGAGLIALGQGISGFAGYMAKIQKESDISDAKDRYTKLKEFALKDKAERWGLMLGDNITKDFQSVNNTVWSGKRDELNGTLSEGAQKYFKDYADLADLQRQTAQFAHITQQRDVVEVDRYNSQNKLSIQATAEHARNADEMAIGTELVEGWDRIQKFGEKRGWSADKIEEAQLLQASAIHATVIGRFVDDRRMDAARDWIDRFGSPSTNEETGVYDPGMTEAHRSAALELIRNANAVEEAQDVVEGLDPDMSFAEGRKHIKDTMSGEAQEHALRMWGADKQAGEFNRQDGYRVAEADAFEIYNSWVDHENIEMRLSPMDAFYKIPQTVRDRMDPKSLSAMRRMAEIRSQGQSIHTIYSAWDELMSMSPDEFRAANLNHYVDRISTADLKTLRNAQLDPQQYGLLLTDASILKEVVTGVLGTDSKGKMRGTPEDQIAIQTEFNKRIQEAAEEKGKALTKPEKDKLAKALLIDITKKNRFFLFGSDRGPSTLTGIDDVVKAINLTIPGVPEREIMKYVQELEAQKIPGEELEIEDWQILELYYADNPDQRPRVKGKAQRHPTPAVQEQLLKNQSEYQRLSGE